MGVSILPLVFSPRRVGVLATLFSVLAALPAHAAKTDVVVLRNGDRLTGEIEQLDRGRLRVSTDDLGTVEIEWDKVASVAASAPFDVDDLPGNRYMGALAPGPLAGQLLIAWKGQTWTVDQSTVVRIRRLNTSFWARLNGSVDLGASYTSASSLFSLDFAAKLGVERPGHEFAADASSTLTSQPGVEETRRNALALTYARRLPNLWVVLAQGQLEQNRELGFDLRTSTAAGGGRYLAQSRQAKLLTALGLSLNRERPTDGETTTNLEAMAMVHFDRFSYDFPKVDVSVAVVGFASLTEGGRYRLEVDARLKRELVKDFHATLRGYESYDSRPATAGVPTSDYGITFALGWSF